MTNRLPLRALGLMVYTLGVLGAAFGISYAVFEWRDTTDYGACHKTLLDFTLTTRLVEKGELSGSALDARVHELLDAYNRNC